MIDGSPSNRRRRFGGTLMEVEPATFHLDF